MDGIVVAGKGVDPSRAKALAEKFDTRVLSEIPENKDAVYFLLDKTGLSYHSGSFDLKGDFSRLLPRVTGGHLSHEILLKAAKFDKSASLGPRAVDATAGLGEDAFILAAAGYRVTMFEHNPITAALLGDALLRAKASSSLREIAGRMTLSEGDSKQLLTTLSFTPDLIYLDPMFPEKKKSSETKKKLQVLHTIEAPCSDEEQLLRAALDLHPGKIVIKRPAGGPFLCGITPSYSIPRTAVRFDVIVPFQ